MTFATYLLLASLVAVALWTVQTTILRAAIGLAGVSVLLTILMFQMAAPIAGAFELSVCAGLVTAVFVSAISLTRQVSAEEAEQLRRLRARRLRPAIAVAAAVAALLWPWSDVRDVAPAPGGAGVAVRDLLWGERRLDLLGQLVIVFVGVYGFVVIFKDRGERRAPAQGEGGR